MIHRFSLRLFLVFLVVVGVGFFLRTSTLAASSIAKLHVPVCPGPNNEDSVRCHARVVIDQKGKPDTTSTPAAYSPQQFLSAYGLGTGLAAAPQTIAIVDAYDHPNIKADLDTYNQRFGLPFFPDCSPTVTSECFQKVDQNGGTNYPSGNAGWALEISLDVEIAHAICQNCKILLVEANSSSFTDLMTAVETAKSQGAKIISNSYGSSGEFSGQTAYDSHFNVPGTVFTFSSGDSGYGTSYPAASPYVVAVGGTTLNLDSSNHYLSESAWNGSGSGCSKYEAQSSWQTALHLSGCTKRMIADVSADADPNTGAAVYDSVPYNGKSGWFQVGGTSLSAPLIAGVYALSGNVNPPAPYGNTSNLRDVKTGNNGRCSRTAPYLCTASVGYDGPTGLGTPNGFGAF